MTLCTVESAAARIGINEVVLRDMAALGGAPQAYGPTRHPESRFRILLDMDDVIAWDAAGRPIADTSYRKARK